MNDRPTTLPPGFEELEPFVPVWGNEDAADRARLRSARTPEERACFYEAVAARISEALETLDAKELGALDPAENRLLNLLLAYAHVTMAVEVQGEGEPAFAELARHMRITRASADESP